MELSLGLAFPTALRFSFALTCALTGVTIATNVHAQTPASGTAGPVRTTPPDVRTGLRLPEIQLHDPWILADRSTRTYYLYSSASPTARAQSALTRLSEGISGGGGIV